MRLYLAHQEKISSIIYMYSNSGLVSPDATIHEDAM